MKLPLYQVDAFTSRVFAGNPAAVCPLDRWLDNAVLQSIAAENNLAETAFFVREGDGYRLRWFTPTREVDLCGHATLASAHVLFEILGHPDATITFASRSGPLHVSRDGSRLLLDFPAMPAERCDMPAGLLAGLGRKPREVQKARDYLAVYESEEEVRALMPHMESIAALDALGVIATAPARDCDFVSRFFAPAAGIPEDPVTGSAHCTLAPYWAARLGKNRLQARQVSARGGEIRCELAKDRVRLSGEAVLYLEGTIRLPA